ncbi:hypothetical protein J0383_00655 [Flavobacterium endoglycinae]|uniref:Uncharacterized protein n=1 Tax=Flavobacterium endoglycinae TaxID=2816357 RepID=A0ABX7QFE4_9FLAO|nr:hypothetical protein [Flavobacterium endoglycinae]QSW89339.1 hypothetical protein J0383_00655 [Flavobacterium endoglycinae]
MKQSHYIKLLNTSVYHTFYDNTKCNCLHFIPTDKTDKILKKFGFMINTVSNGFDLFANPTSTLSDTLDYISKTASQDFFEFNIKCSNPSFLLFTDLPVNFLGLVNYSSQKTQNEENTSTLVLNQSLETAPIARYFGNLKIYFEDLKNVSNNPILYKISFEARATQWQYYFINKNSLPLNNPVVTQKGSIQFKGPEQVTLQTGEKALLFTSDTTNIPLSEKPKYKFDLINKSESSGTDQGNSKGKVIIKGLPIPDVSRINIISNKEQNQVTSPMYIYL